MSFVGNQARLLACALAVVSAASLPVAEAAAQRGGTAGATLNAELLEPFRFRFVGPANMSGRVTAVAVPEGSGGKTMYIGTAGGGVWKSINQGTTWREVLTDDALASIGDVAVAASNPSVVWVGTGERNSLRSQGWGNGVYRSTDAGASWQHMGLADTREIGRIAIHPQDPNTVYVGAMGHLWGANAERGVFKTTDGGQTWEKILFINDTTGIVDLRMDPNNPEVLYAAAWHRLRWGGGRMEGAGEGSGIYKTTDGGRTWRELTDPSLNNGLPTRSLGRIGLDMYRSDPRVLYAVIQAAHGSTNSNVSGAGGVFRSDDAGESWTRVNDISAGPDYFYNEIYVDPNDDQNVWVNGTFLSRSSDGGRTFARFDQGNIHVDHHALWIDPADSEHMVLGNDGGVYISYDTGDTWAHQIIPVGQFYEIAIDSTKTPYNICGGLQDNGVWCGPSQTREEAGITNADWYTIYGGDGFHSAVAWWDPNIYFAELQFGTISRCNVAEAECTFIKPQAEDAGAESGYDFRWDWNSPFVLSEHEAGTLYMGGNHLFKLTNEGRDWEILGPDMTRQNRQRPVAITGSTSYGALHSIAESPLDRNVLWTGSDDGLIWTTSDGGRTWAMVTDNIRDESPKRCWVSEIEASRFDVRTAYVTFDCHMRDDYAPYVYKTTDAGRSWTNIAGDLETGGGTYVVREDPENPQILYVGTERGLYMSNVGGNRWVRLKNNLPTAAVRDMNFALRADELVVSTMGRSIWVVDAQPLRELTPANLAKQVHLFPVKDARVFNRRDTYESFGDRFFTADNPADGVAITYYVGADLGRDVTLTIRQGDQVVQTLTGSGRPGMHQLRWNLRQRDARPRELGGPTSADALRTVGAGTYTVELRAGGTTETQTFAVGEGWVENLPGRMR